MPHRVMPDHDVGALAQADLLGLRRDRHLGEQRVRAHLRAFGLEMVLGQPERLEAQFLREDALAHLVDQHLLRGGMHLGQRAVIDRDAVLGDDHRKVDAPLWNTPISNIVFLRHFACPPRLLAGVRLWELLTAPRFRTASGIGCRTCRLTASCDAISREGRL